MLRQIYDPPLVLYVRGERARIPQPGIAVIGTRHPTPYGLGMAERLSCDLAAIAASSSSAAWPAASTPPRIVAR